MAFDFTVACRSGEAGWWKRGEGCRWVILLGKCVAGFLARVVTGRAPGRTVPYADPKPLGLARKYLATCKGIPRIGWGWLADLP